MDNSSIGLLGSTPPSPLQASFAAPVPSPSTTAGNLWNRRASNQPINAVQKLMIRTGADSMSSASLAPLAHGSGSPITLFGFECRPLSPLALVRSRSRGTISSRNSSFDTASARHLLNITRSRSMGQGGIPSPYEIELMRQEHRVRAAGGVSATEGAQVNGRLKHKSERSLAERCIIS